MAKSTETVALPKTSTHCNTIMSLDNREFSETIAMSKKTNHFTLDHLVFQKRLMLE